MNAKTKTAAAAALGLAVAAFTGYGLWQAAQPAPEVFQGQMEAREADIAPKLSARIAQVLVKEGDQITVGTPLVRLDSPEVAAKMAQATAAQAAAQAVARKAEHGARPQEIDMARLAWQRAQTAAELAETSFQRVEGLAREGLIATQKRDEADANRKAATRRWPPRPSTTWPAPVPAPKTRPPPPRRRAKWPAWWPRFRPRKPRPSSKAP